MKLRGEIREAMIELSVDRDGNKIFAEVNGRRYELEVSEPEPNVYAFKHNGKVFEVYVPPADSASDAKVVNINAHQFDIRIIDPKRLRGTRGDDAHGAGPAEIKTAMPGKVVRILEEVGAQVEKGQAIIVIEAMKMQNELKSPKSGTVKEIRVEAGSTVSSGDVLVTIE
ncbi:MAG: biotin/lipoyl-containing protein [Pyrinomonadaceae bacterium]